MNEILLFLGGIVALVLGAESLVRGASKLALSFGISPLVVGLTVVAFGTSAPETTVSVSAVLTGQTDIAVGNVVGSNIFNVLFILGLSALITPLPLLARSAACANSSSPRSSVRPNAASSSRITCVTCAAFAFSSGNTGPSDSITEGTTA